MKTGPKRRRLTNEEYKREQPSARRHRKSRCDHPSVDGPGAQRFQRDAPEDQLQPNRLRIQSGPALWNLLAALPRSDGAGGTQYNVV